MTFTTDWYAAKLVAWKADNERRRTELEACQETEHCLLRASELHEKNVQHQIKHLDLSKKIAFVCNTHMVIHTDPKSATALEIEMYERALNDLYEAYEQNGGHNAS